MPPMSSGSDVVGAATMPPDGAYAISFRSSALRNTCSRYGPSYWSCDDHLRQNASVSSMTMSASPSIRA